VASGKSSLYYPNKFARAYLVAMEDVMGKNSLHAALKMAGLNHFIKELPPDNLKREFDFADFTAVNVALEELYGPRGGRGLALRAGRACFAEGLRNFGALAGARDPVFRAQPLALQVKVGLHGLAGIFTHFSDQQTHINEHETSYDCVVEQSPVCWGRRADRPVCHALVGMIQETLRWVSFGHEFWVVETECQAVGDEHCAFNINKQPIG
jgi:predicted hydrocarbon binding protein